MTIERLQLLRNVGQFDSVTAGAQIPLTKLSLIYAENGRGNRRVRVIGVRDGFDLLAVERFELA